MEPRTGDGGKGKFLLRSLRNLFGRNNNETQTPRQEKNDTLPQGVLTDQKLLQYLFGRKGIDAHPIATDSFLDKSREEYNSAWLTRELVQNFVDHNPQEPGTLNGVKFTIENLTGGGKRFIIRGNWPFPDPTGVLSPHSEKPQDMNTAGGNGIGLKQTAIRLMRDFGAKKFEIQGEGWTVDYSLARADEMNQEWDAVPNKTPLHRVKHDWLVASIEETKNHDNNQYIIETDNAELIKALSQLPTLGVSRENPYLQGMDFQNQFGAIKWVPRDPDGKSVRGRLFINGQVMNFREKGDSAENYWVGPEQVTIQLNNVDYKISVDRPPISAFDLSRYLEQMVSAMSKDDILDQLRKSESLWAGHSEAAYSSEREGADIVIERMIRELPWKGYDVKEYAELFRGKNYICWDRGVSESQIHELEKQGFIICPSYLDKIGMPKASSKLSTMEAASNIQPSLTKYKKEQVAQEYGMEVSFEDFSIVKEPAAFFRLVGDRLALQISGVEPRTGKSNTLRLKLAGDIPKDLLFHALTRPKDDPQKMLYFLRGMAAYGLDKNIFKKIFTSQGEFVTTFATEYDPVMESTVLIARNVKNNSDEGSFIEIELDEGFFQPFQEGISKAIPKQSSEESSDQSSANLPGIDTPLKQPQTINIESGKKGVENSETKSTMPWTDDDRRLYTEASRKDLRSLSQKEREILAKQKLIEQALGAVPINQPKAPNIKENRVIKKEGVLSPEEQKRLAQMQFSIAGIVETVNELNELIPEKTWHENKAKSEIEKYLEWRNSEQFYGQLGDNAGYITGRHLLEILEENQQADIAVVESSRKATPEEQILSTLKDKLDEIIDWVILEEEDQVDEFEIVTKPSESALAQLGLLRLYAHLTTGVALPNDLFIYEGTGSKGINLDQKAIGLHQSLFKVKFTEALRTFSHEIAHNQAMDHEVEFRHTMESLFVTMIDKVTRIALKLQLGQPITDEERVILDVQKEWEKLATA